MTVWLYKQLKIICISTYSVFFLGTSGGSFISYALVGGNQDKDGKRIPMSVKEVLTLALKNVNSSWEKSKNGKGFIDWILKKKGSLGEMPLTPFSSRNLKHAIEEVFGKTCLTNEIGYKGCIAGAVAHQFNEDPINMPDILEIFDSMSEPQQIVSEVLVGSGNAPIYFENPCKIGNQNYIDGGILGKFKSIFYYLC